MPRVSVVRTSLSALLTPSRTACEKRVERGRKIKGEKGHMLKCLFTEMRGAASEP